MKKKMKRKWLKKLTALGLALAVGVTFIPLLGDSVYAEGEGADIPDAVVNVEGGDAIDVVIDGEEPEPAGEGVTDITPGEEPAAEDAGGVTVTNETGDADDTGAITGDDAAISDEQLDSFNEAIEENMVTAAASSVFTFTTKQVGNKLYLGGTITNKNYQFSLILMDLQYPIDLRSTSFTSGFDISEDYIDLSQYGTGYHSFGIIITTKKDPNTAYDAWGKQYIPVNLITDKPSYKGSFTVYSKSLEIYPYNMSSANKDSKLYLEYKTPKAKTWKRSGYMTCNLIQLAIQQGFKLGGLKPKTKYKTRLRYGEYVTYSSECGGDDKAYFFGGPVLNSKTIKTGVSKKPKIKSVTAKAIKVKFHKNKVPGHYEWIGSSLIWIKPYTEKYYTYKVKVTVKLKKKPGTKGIWINGKFVKGNKKTYTAKFKPYPNYSAKKPKGHIKWKVKVRSYQGKSFGGYSPVYVKTKRLK